MVGVTLYVSITTEESVKFNHDSSIMEYSYGYSFLCAVLSFVLQELTSVLTVYWFIYRFRALVRKQEKLRERTRQLMGNCLSMTSALPLNFAAFTPINHQTNSIPINLNHVATKPLQRRRIPFGKSLPSLSFQPISNLSYHPPQSPTLAYGDYCRVLIRAEDLNLLTQMVKSKSQAQLLTHSRPTTPAPKIAANSRLPRQTTDNTVRRNTKKGFKRTTSV